MSDPRKSAATAEIIDAGTGNTIASFAEPKAAGRALIAMVGRRPEEAPFLILTFFDKEGMAIGSRLASDLGTEEASPLA